MDRSSPSVAQSASAVSGALIPRTSELSAEIYALIVREIPQLRSDERVLTLLEASVRENVATLLHVLQHGIDLENVRAPAAAEEYARRLAQRGVPMAALLRAYRIGSARFQAQCLEELGRRTDDAQLVSAAGLRIADITAAYIDRVSEELVSAYEGEKENWLRNLSAARAARRPGAAAVSGLTLRWTLPRRDLGIPAQAAPRRLWCWTGEADIGGGDLARLERATMELPARWAAQGGRSSFRRMSLTHGRGSRSAPKRPLTLPGADSTPPRRRPGPVRRPAASALASGFRRTHQQALAAYAVALAANTPGRFLTSFSDVALALMPGSIDLVRAWVIEILGGLRATMPTTPPCATPSGCSCKRTAVQGHRAAGPAQETPSVPDTQGRGGLGHPVGENRLHVELALLASQWLGRQRRGRLAPRDWPPR
jgi:hypothetical protein